MIVSCPKCDRPYNDEFRWTVCPHNNLGEPHMYPHQQCPNEFQTGPNTEWMKCELPVGHRGRHRCLTHEWDLTENPPHIGTPTAMTPDEYQKLAERTECDQTRSRYRMTDEQLTPIRLNHAVIGLAGEVGELASAVQKWIYYGKPLDVVNVEEEFGDCLWYIAEGLNALGVSMQAVMESNIAKLKKRYPDKYTDACAAEENRDRLAERKAMSTGTVIHEERPHPLIGKRMKPKYQTHPLYYVEPNTRIVISVSIDKSSITLVNQDLTDLRTEPIDQWMAVDV